MNAPSLRYDETGPDDGPLVVLVHGGMDRSTSFLKVARRLPSCRVLRYDRRGYARNLDVGGPFTIERHAQDLVEILAGRPGVLVGHSLGGVVALAAATASPDLARAVGAYEAPMSWMPWHTSMYARESLGADVAPEDAAERFLRRAIGDRLWDRLPARTRAERRAEGHCLVGELHDVRRAAPYDLERLLSAEVPVLAAHGSESAPHLVRAARELAASAGSEPVVFDGADHGAHASHPDQFAAFVAQLLALAR